MHNQQKLTKTQRHKHCRYYKIINYNFETQNKKKSNKITEKERKSMTALQFTPDKKNITPSKVNEVAELKAL